MSGNAIDADTIEAQTTDSDAASDEGEAADDTDAADAGEGGDERGAAHHEAAKYRRQLRDAEAHRDQLGKRLAVMQRSEAEALARGILADGADMWRDGLELSAVLDDDGNLDPTKVEDAAKAARKAHPHWAAPQPYKGHPRRRNGSFASGATGRGPHDATTTSWQKVLNTRLGD